MRIKFIHVENTRLLEKCRLGDRKSQRLLYEKYADLMLGLCRRYLSNIHAAEDAMMKGFVKVFTQLNKLQDDDKFEGWMRRIMANECLMILRKKNRQPTSEIEEHTMPPVAPIAVDRLSEADILAMIDRLPDGYRTVFNMYVIEGYKHKEIADHLNISVNTSKSQLIMARRKLQSMMDAPDQQLPKESIK